MANKVRIISDAFVLLGKKAINNLDIQDNPIHIAASSLFDLLLPDLISKCPWRNAIRNTTLNRINQTPNNSERWRYAYKLPDDPDFIMLYKTYPEMDYQIYEDYLLCNVLEVKVDYLFKISPARFPIFFTSLITYALAYHLGMAVTQDINIVKFWAQKYEQQKIIAMGSSLAQVPSQIIGHDKVYQAHFV